MKKIVQLIVNNAPLKICSLLIAYGLWSLIAVSRERERTYAEIPICFYGTDQETMSTTPETISVTLRGTRTALQTIDTDELAVHVDSNRIEHGDHALAIRNEDLLLPSSVKVIQCLPGNIVVHKQTLETVIHNA